MPGVEPARRARRLRTLLAALGFTLMAQAAAPAGVALVLLHGKQDVAPFAIDPLVQALRTAGYTVVAPEMPWSERRNFDADQAAARAELAAAVAALRAQGLRRIVVGGHGLGGNTALSYAAHGGDADALLLVAPAHTPEARLFIDAVGADAERARAEIAAGRGAERASYRDFDHRQPRPVTTTAAIYWSYYDPTGGAAMSASARRLRPLPVLWLHGSYDALREEGKAIFFDLLPAHPLTRYQPLATPFGGTPRVAAEPALAWLAQIDAR